MSLNVEIEGKENEGKKREERQNHLNKEEKWKAKDDEGESSLEPKAE